MEALYRKYRPTTFSDVVGQEHIERTLKNAIEQGKVSHAYLFCGPRGTGKTTMARILAKALLCEKGPTTDPDGTCPECEAIAQGNHPDVYELDAASRTGVDNVREEIIARVNYAPTRGAWKVYIIDEVHMLTTAAFNALLKTLEEPPEHIVFILCTTDPQKVPDTIQSRCQRFDFHRISHEAIVSRLGAICVKEGVDFEGEALDLIAYRAEGGMRNALTSLEQLIAFGGGHVTLEGAQNLLGSLDETDLSEIILAIGKRDAPACFNWVERYIETGADLAQFVDDLSEYVRDLYLLSMAGIEVELTINEATRKAMVDQLRYFGRDRLSRALVVLGDLSKELRSASNPRLSFEIALTRMIRPESDLTLESLAERIEELEQKLAAGQFAQGSFVQTSSAVVPTQAAGSAALSVAPSAAQATAPESAVQARISATREPSGVSASTSSSSFEQAPSREPVPVANTIAPAPATAMSSQGTPETRVPADRVPTAMPAQVPASRSASQAPFVSTGSTPASATVAPSTGSVSLPIDVMNPSALQRFWHTVTSNLRKVNPARGVLFMNAKVSGEANGSGVIISFAKDNGFAYTAAQKPEVQKLLTQTMTSVAGGSVPFRLVLEGGGSVRSTAMPSAASAPEARPAGSAAQAVSSQVERVREAVRAAQTSAKQAAKHDAVSSIASPEAISATDRSANPASVMDSARSASTFSQVPSAPVQTPERIMSSASSDDSAPVPEDQVPLEAYGNAFFDEETIASDSSMAGGAVPVARSTEASVVSSPSSVPAASVERATSASSSSANTMGSENISSDDEASQIKAILSGSFGEGIKFEEL